MSDDPKAKGTRRRRKSGGVPTEKSGGTTELSCPNCEKKYDGPPPKEGDLLFCPACDAVIPVAPAALSKSATPEKKQTRSLKRKHLEEPQPTGPTVLLCPTCKKKIEAPDYTDGEIRFCDDCDSSMVVETKSSLGKTLGRYTLDEEVGRGGMAVVYKATQQGLNRPVAVKVLLAGEGASEDSIQQLQAEAQAAANLRHPNIVTVLDVGEFKGLHYIAMDLIEGKPLNSALGKRRIKGKNAAAMMGKIARAIEHAHEAGIVHRDIKPSNILLEKGEEPKIMDFGLALSRKGAKDGQVAGVIAGTPAYMPPEQARGEEGKIDRRSDVYSLGAVLYAVLTGKPPFKKETAEKTLEAVLKEDPKPPRMVNAAIPDELEAICLKAMSRDRENRYPSAKALAEDLERFIRGEAVTALPSNFGTNLVRLAKKNPLVFAGAGAVAVVFLLIVILLVAGGGNDTPDRGPKKDDSEQKKQQAQEAKAEAQRKWDNAKKQAKDLVLSRIQAGKERVRAKIETARAQSQAGNPDQALHTLEEAELMLREMGDKALRQAPQEFIDDLVEDADIRAEAVARHDMQAIEQTRAAARGVRAWQIWSASLDVDAARAEYNLALQTLPDEPTLLLGRGMVLREAAQWKAALADLKRVQEQNPGLLKNPENLKYYLDAALRGEAPELVEPLLEQLPDDATGKEYYRGLYEMMKGDFEKAKASLAKARSKSFLAPEPHVAIAEVVFREGKPAEAEKALGMLISTAQQYLSSIRTEKDARGKYLDRRGLIDGLALRAEIRLALAETTPQAESLEHRRGAQADYEEILKINPSDARAIEGLKKMGVR